MSRRDYPGARAAAYTVLLKRQNAEQAGALAAAKPEERRLAYTLAGGVYRHARSLDRIVGAFSKTPVRSIAPKGLAVLLRMGVLQLVYLDGIPDYSAVDETVEMAGRLFGRKKAGFVNAVLRNVQRSMRPSESREGYAADTLILPDGRRVGFDRAIFPDPATDLDAYLAAIGSVGIEFIRLLRDQFDMGDVEEILAASASPPTHYVFDLAAAADGRLVCAKADGPVVIGKDQYVMDPAQAEFLPALPEKIDGDVLDMCAAPGGKSVLVGKRYPENRLIACDINPARLEKVTENFRRVGFSRAALTACDALHPPFMPDSFGLVLADVPCSNTGVYRRRPESKARLDGKGLEKLVQLEKKILASAATLVKPGGCVLYLTCSVLAGENDEVVDGFLDASEGFELVAEKLTLPRRDGHDGGYFALIRRH